MLKRILPLLVATLLFMGTINSALLSRLVAADTVPTNLIQNASVENLDSSNAPTNWTADNWGTSNTTLTTTTDAHTGSHALTVSTTSRASGDAKWIPDAATVTPGSSYNYGEFYKSSVASEIDAVYTTAAGAVSYAYITGLPASASWQPVNVTVTIPAGMQKVSIMHILATAGSVTTDDFSLTVPTAPVVVPPPTSGNLIANPAMETSNGQSPANWQSDSWGTNTAAFSYDQTGHTGRSVSVSISSYTNGDAKWYANPVSVTAGSAYTYSDYYKASTGSRTVLAYTNASNATTYVELAPAPASAGWSQYTASFTVPATITQVTAYHLLSAVGTLSLDDASLTVGTATPPTPPNPPAANGIIANSSVETSTNGSTPDGWESDGWGTNTAAYSYSSDAHTGSKSVKTTISSYTNGDAKWYFAPVTNINPGKTYSFSTWYKSSVQVGAVAAFTMTNGTTNFVTLSTPGAPNTSNWQQYKTNFDIPVGAKDATVYMLIANVGWVETDDYSLAPYVATPFTEGLVSLTFDDGWQSSYINGLPLLKKYKLTSTQFIVSGYIGASMYMTKSQIQAFQTQGSEIGSHTVSHPDLTTLNQVQLTNELKNSQVTLQSLFGKSAATSIATPYGAYNDNVLANIKLYYASQRSVDSGFNSKDNFNPYNVVVQNVDANTPNSQVAAWVAEAKSQKTWLVLVYHQVENTIAPGDIYAVKTSNLNTQLAGIKASGVTVKTYGAAFKEVSAQF